MEDILASIRRILSEDEVTENPTGQAAQPPHPKTPLSPPGHEMVHPVDPAGQPPDGDGVLQLSESMLVPPQPPDVPRRVPEPPVAAKPESGLLAPESAAAAKASVGSLLRTLSGERAVQVHRGGPTIEDIVREELRPLLSAWLDQHLPPLVERLVHQEIQRVTSRDLS